jgi:hypothetical protein
LFFDVFVVNAFFLPVLVWFTLILHTGGGEGKEYFRPAYVRLANRDGVGDLTGLYLRSCIVVVGSIIYGWAAYMVFSAENDPGYRFVVLVVPGYFIIGNLLYLLILKTAPPILARMEEGDAGHPEKCRTYKQLINMAFENERRGLNTEEAMRAEVEENREAYLDPQRAAQITSRFNDASSPIFDDGSRRNTACFAKRHLRGMREVAENKVPRIVEVLAKYHRYEWDLLKLAQSRETPKTEAQQWRDATIGANVEATLATIDDYQEARRVLREKQAERRERIMADNTLTEDGKKEEIAQMDAYYDRQLELLARRFGHVT